MAKSRSPHTTGSAPENKDINLSGVVMDKLKTSFDSFDKISEDKRIDLYGDKDLILQFRDHFKKTNPNLLDQIDQNDLPVYLQALEKKWFKLGNLKEEAKILKEEIWESESELGVIKSSLGKLKDFCAAPINKIPPHIFNDFATEAGFSASPLTIDATSNIRSVDDLWKRWKRFAETKNVTVDWQIIRLKDFHNENISTILCPDYNPTERIVVQIAIEKIRKTLPAPLKADFDLVFPLPIDAHSAMVSLDTFKTSWQTFLDTHETEIDGKLRKKLDDTIVTNWDIKNWFIREWHDFDDTVSFSHREKRFRRIFNKLATRQLFEEVRATSEAVEKYADNIADAFIEFPPYVNQIFKKYPYNQKTLDASDPEFAKELSVLDSELNKIDAAIVAEQDKEKKKELLKKKKELKKQKEMCRWLAYTKWLASKDAKLSGVISKLYQNNFDFNKLDSVSQQEILNVLVQSKLDDLIKTKVPELLKIDQANFSKFVKDLFDMSKKQVLIPTVSGNYPINFKSKSFVSSELNKFFSIDDLNKLENLPLNFEVDMDESNRDFFEKSPLFAHLFYDFDSKNWTKKISDSYKVKIKKWDKELAWYLSAYPPINLDELEMAGRRQNKKNQTWEGENEDMDMSDYMFLYSSPVSNVDQNRDLITDGNWDPIFFPKNKESDRNIEIVDRKLDLTWRSINSLLMAYVLGQESMDRDFSAQAEKEIGEKFRNMKNTNIVDKADGDSSENNEEKKEDKEKKEKSDYEKCIAEWDKIQWYKFPSDPKASPEKIDPKWFVEWSSFLINFGSSLLPPWMGDKYIRAEIVNIDKANGKFTLKFAWWEAKLGKFEWHKQEFDLSADGLNQFKDMFGGWNIYKLPDTKKYKWKVDGYIDVLSQAGFESDINKSFGNVKWKWDKFQFVNWDYAGKDVEYFGRYEPTVWETDDEKWSMYLYKISHNLNWTINVSSDFKIDGNNVKYSRDMDYDTFITFISSKKLQPKSKEQWDDIKKKVYWWPDAWAKEKMPFFSINSVISFFKNIPGKVKDGVKKYDEEKTEDLTEMIVQKRWLYRKLASVIPSERMAWAFMGMDIEYNLDRDNRVWKKIEKRLKVFESDPHFPSFFGGVLSKMIKWEKPIKDRYTAAALLLAVIKKWKWPYAKLWDMVGRWLWVRMILWEEHQSRFLKMREMKQRQIQQNMAAYWRSQVEPEMDSLVEFEMQYLIHVTDGRQMSVSPDEENYLASRRSRQFAGKLEEYSWDFFKKSNVEEWFWKISPTTNFEAARFEYFGKIWDRPMQAIPFLKQMALKAITPRDWKIFEKAVVVGMLSGSFLHMTKSHDRSFIQKICRSIWFLPWIRVREMDQQTKVAKLLDVASGWKFSKISKYNPANFSLWNMVWVKWLVSVFSDNADMDRERDKIGWFLDITSGKKNNDGKTLMEIYDDPKTPSDQKKLLWEVISMASEKDESFDNQIMDNGKAVVRNVFNKSQSVVNDYMRFQWWEFAWKNNDERQISQAFWSQVASDMPKWKQSPSMVEYFLKRFDNWFGSRWFSDTWKSVFVRRLMAIKNHPSKKEKDDMLWYTIVWTIIRNSGSGWIPSELRAGLESFKSFFESNMDAILDPNMIEKTMWVQYKSDLERPYEVGNWSDYVEATDKDIYQWVVFSAQKEEKDRINLVRRKLALPKYINKDLYRLATELERYGEENRFKSYYQDKVDTKKQLAETLVPNRWVRVKNKETLSKLKDALENKNKPEWMTSEEQSMIMDEGWYYDDSDYYE